MEIKTPNPGSDEAVAGGCTCPVLDNDHGAGHYSDGDAVMFIMDAACPLHGEEAKP